MKSKPSKQENCTWQRVHLKAIDLRGFLPGAVK